MLSRRLLRIKVIKTLYAHFKSETESLIISEKNLINSVDKTYDLYHQMLHLIVDVANYAGERIELGRNKRLPSPEDLNPNLRFVENRVIAQIDQSEALGDYIARRKVGWVKYPELIKSLYNAMVESDYYKAYMSRSESSYKDDMKLVENFYTRTVDDNEQVEAVLEEQSIMWSDDMDFALIMVVRTLNSCRASQSDVPLLPQYKSDDDEQFLRDLFRKTLINYADNLVYIEKFTQNWDIERIAFVDNLIMATAMAELTSFPSIPVKVTLDEYIEIAKYYSTPGSSLFINGVLDKIIEALQQESRIEKVGRGLI